MHYYIDGYNLLFRSAWQIEHKSLEELRHKLIVELDKEACLLHLQMTIVFDAPLQSDESKRGHFRSLEIIFTSFKETADDYLIHTFRQLTNPKKALLITSDRDLQHRAKCLGVQSKSVEEFLSMLRKKCHKKKFEKPQPAPIKMSGPKKEERKLQVPKRAAISMLKRKKMSKEEQELPELTDLGRWEKLFKDRQEQDKQ